MVSLLAVALAVIAAVAALRPRLGVPVALGLGIAVLAATSAAAVSYDIALSARVSRTFVGGGPGWVDAAGLGHVSLLQTPYSSRAGISEQLFWNRSLSRILHLPESTEVDAYGSVPTRIAADGSIVAAGRTVREPLLVQEYASWMALEGARLVERVPGSALRAPSGTPRVAMLLAGRYLDGWLRRAQPRHRLAQGGRASQRNAQPHPRPSSGTPPVTLDLRGPGLTRVVRIAPGQQRTLTFAVHARRPWTLSLRPRRPSPSTARGSSASRPHRRCFRSRP